jgi:hypothetical protein
MFVIAPEDILKKLKKKFILRKTLLHIISFFMIGNRNKDGSRSNI